MIFFREKKIERELEEFWRDKKVLLSTEIMMMRYCDELIAIINILRKSEKKRRLHVQQKRETEVEPSLA